jgi:nucleotide-binding universal stress UspA family protein
MFNSVQLADRGSSKPPASGEGAKDAVGDAVKGTSEDGERTQHAKDDKMEADVTVRDVDSHREEAVAREARKGYDLLFIGVERARKDRRPPCRGCPNRLAVRGTTGDRRGKRRSPSAARSEPIAPACPRQWHSRFAPGGRNRHRGRSRPRSADCGSLRLERKSTQRCEIATQTAPSGHEQAILKDIVEIPDQYGQPIDTVVRSAIAPDEAILAEARRRGSNLIVMGVAGRPGENLFSGDTAASVLEKTPTSVLFLST